MKRFNMLIAIVAVLSLPIHGCKKGDPGPQGLQGEQGDPGPQGAQGAQGPQGIAGNANVTQYTYGAHNFATTASATLQVTTTADTMNRSAWHVYLVRASGNVYPIPGFGLNGSSDYRLYWSHSGGKVNFSINKVSGPGEEYASMRIIRIYANQTAAGGRASNPLPDIDFNDYYAVCRYYGLPY
ncbi:collagen-like protein [Chitinophaga sp. XS-30]|uniref:collagen-like protein n=1 Tax=Chitinophaga sp. XS-30 TaxID=2604421 RepID=UPI0011DD2329|nr:collagen-like protein [Chitinophaga sp. XS-30]QEH41214.1 collagen-like protein [Chitinophaga sp. XS-30]